MLLMTMLGVAKPSSKLENYDCKMTQGSYHTASETNKKRDRYF